MSDAIRVGSIGIGHQGVIPLHSLATLDVPPAFMKSLT
jgi:hypothetical protein